MYHVLVGNRKGQEDVIHRSLQSTYPGYFVKPHYHVLLAINRRQGRDTSVPTSSRQYIPE